MLYSNSFNFNLNTRTYADYDKSYNLDEDSIESIRDSKLRFDGSGTYLNLQLEPKSDAAKRLIADLTRRIRKSSSGPVRPLENALGALVADLLAAANADANGYGYRLTGTKTFTGKRVGWKPFLRAADGLEELGYLHREVGIRSGGSGAPTGRASRFKLTQDFLGYAATYGVVTGKLWNHFGFPPPPLKVKKPITVKSYSTRNYALRTKTAGRSMAVNYSLPKVIAAAKFVQDYNAFISTFQFNFDHAGFHRIFNNGNKAGFNYDEGGRLYAVGGSYQSWPQRSNGPARRDRAGITINGCATVEIDIGASHYTIAASRTGIPLVLGRDQYNVAGFPRSIIKAWVNACLGNGKQLSKWPNHLKLEYAKPDEAGKPNRFRADLSKGGFVYTGNLQRDFPIATMKSRVTPLFPIIDNIEGRGIGWGELQYRESCIIVDALDDLMRNHGIPALPVHDSLICRECDQLIVSERLSYWFERHTGLRPNLGVK